MRTEEPRAIHLADYKAPEFRIATVHLDFALEPEATRVTAKLAIERRSGPARWCWRAKTEAVSVSAGWPRAREQRLSCWTTKASPSPDPPDRLILEIVSEIAPAANTALEGLYPVQRHVLHPMRAGRLSPHHLFPRPARQSFRLHRADRGGQGAISGAALQRQPDRKAAILPGGRHFAVWHDPFPKPSYLFALVAGDLGVDPRQLHHHERAQGGAGHLCRAWQRAARPLTPWMRSSAP